MAETAWLEEMDDAASRSVGERVNPAVPQSEAGKKLSKLLAGSRVFADLPHGCGQRDSCDAVGMSVRLELWCSPARAVVETACRLPATSLSNVWLGWLDGELVGVRGFAHRGEALDALAAALVDGGWAAEADEFGGGDADEAIDTAAGVVMDTAAAGVLPLGYTADC